MVNTIQFRIITNIIGVTSRIFVRSRDGSRTHWHPSVNLDIQSLNQHVNPNPSGALRKQHTLTFI
uniref:Uncharacterized protein n=1 Tax=mine drainage metagenome TaxID=410659 RepID=E6QS41_9ZZZZ